ncbi:hypothetical protein CFP66_11510 [Pseudonocardia sp. MH-G8]|nr:hypothetical protein CFP66_11510 [Pseudonocardia sp. MH-G8]
MLRACVVAGLCALLTAAGHTAGGGTAPDLAVLVVLLPLLAYGLVDVAGRCRSAAGSVGVLAAGQLVLHHVMELLHPTHQVAHATLAPGAQMVTMHALATLLTGLALRHADRGVAALLAALGRVLPRRLVPPPADRPLPVLAVPAPAVPARLARAFAVAHARRGPPVTC